MFHSAHLVALNLAVFWKILGDVVKNNDNTNQLSVTTLENCAFLVTQ